MEPNSPPITGDGDTTKEKPKHLITFKNVSKVFRDDKGKEIPVFHDISFDINYHEIISFIGPSGCGKTTVLRILASLEHPTSGEIKIKNMPVAMGVCGMVFQSYSSFPWLTILDNVALGLKLRHMEKQERYDIAAKYISLVGLNGFEHRYPKELSGGQKQRVAIARSLCVENEILLMDEPFGALDIKIRSEMQELMLRIWKELKTTIILVTHDIQEAIYLPNRIFAFSGANGSAGKNNSPISLEYIEIDKPLESRTPDWKHSGEFEYYEKKVKALQFN